MYNTKRRARKLHLHTDETPNCRSCHGFLLKQGEEWYCFTKVATQLICVSRIAIYKLLHKHRDGRGVGDHERKLSEEHIAFIDNSMAENDELSSRQLRHLLEDRWPGFKSISPNRVKSKKGFGLGLHSSETLPVDSLGEQSEAFGVV